MALYNDLPVFKDVYKLTLRIFELTMGFSREFKHSLGQDMKRDCLTLLRDIYRINRSHNKAPLFDAFLDDFELLKLEIRLCADLKLLSLVRQAELMELTDTIGKQITGWRNSSSGACPRPRKGNEYFRFRGTIMKDGCIRRSGRVSLRIPFRLRAFSSAGRATDF